MIKKRCICGKIFETYPSKIICGRGKFCSKKCKYNNSFRPSGLKYNIKVVNRAWFKAGDKPFYTGKMMKKINEYSNDFSSLHKWLRRHWGVPIKCQKCGGKKNLEWANKTGQYLRIKSDWLHLCKKCHNKYDYEKFGARKEFYL